MDQKDAQALTYLAALTRESWEVIRAKSMAGTLQHLMESYQHIDIEGFRYDETGPGYTQSSHSTLFRQDWRRTAFDIHDIVAKSAAFNTAKEYAVENYSYPHIEHLFVQYAFQLYDLLFQHRPQVINITALELHYVKFLRDLKQAEHPAKATVYLSGITIESPQIILDEHTILRQTLVGDMATKKHHNDSVLMIAYPSAVMEMSYERKYNDYSIIHQAMGKYTRLLRLFRTASIKRDYYEIEYETVTAPKKSSGGDESSMLIWRKYCLKKEDEALFQIFLAHFKLPENFGAHDRQPDYLSTAHDRYKESLLEIVPVERRIANAIMGLEALISDKNAELNYRLSNRAAKLLGFLGLNPLQIRRNLIKAYDIRSQYAHGGFVKPAERAKLNQEYGSVDEFAYTVIDYLRRLFIIMTQCNTPKSQLLMLIDDALIDSQSHLSLEQIVEPVKQFFA